MYKLILVDDEQLALEQMGIMIERAKINIKVVGTFRNGKTALKYINSNVVDIVVTDIKMPIMNGLELTKICYEEFPNIKFVLTSGYRDFEYAIEGIKYKVSAYVLKPIMREDFFSVINSIVEKLDENVKSIEFSMNDLKSKFQEVLSALFCGVMENEQELKISLNTLNLAIDSKAMPCALVNIYIDNFDNYLNSVWRYGQLRFYNAINNIIPLETEFVYATVVGQSVNNIEVIIINKSGQNDMDNNVLEILNFIKTQLLTMLKLETNFKVYKKFNSLSTIIEDKTIKTNINQSIEKDELVNKAIKYIEDNYQSQITLEDISKHICLSATYFCSYFKKQTNKTFIDYLNEVRIEKAKKLLANKELKISNISDMVGYKSQSYFHNIFKAYCNNITPAQYRILFHKDGEPK